MYIGRHPSTPSCLKFNETIANVITNSTYRKTWMFYSGCWTGVDRARTILSNQLVDVLNHKYDNEYTYVFGTL